MTDPNVRNVLFDPRCGWVLISGGVYLGTSQRTGRSAALVALCERERRLGMREPTANGERTAGRVESFERLSESWNHGAKRADVYNRLDRQQ